MVDDSKKEFRDEQIETSKLTLNPPLSEMNKFLFGMFPASQCKRK